MPLPDKDWADMNNWDLAGTRPPSYEKMAHFSERRGPPKEEAAAASTKPLRTLELGALAKDFPNLCRLMEEGYEVRMDEANRDHRAALEIYLSLVDRSGRTLFTAYTTMDHRAIMTLGRKGLEDKKAAELISLLHNLEHSAAALIAASAVKDPAGSVLKDLLDMKKMVMGKWPEPTAMATPEKPAATPEELADSDKLAEMLYHSFKDERLKPGFKTSMPGGGKFEVWELSHSDGKRIGTTYTKGAGETAVTTYLPEDEPTTVSMVTSESNLDHSREMLANTARDLAAQLSRDLRHDKDCFRELKAGGQLVRDIEITIAGQRISVTLELEGLGEDPK